MCNSVCCCWSCIALLLLLLLVIFLFLVAASVMFLQLLFGICYPDAVVSDLFCL